MLFDKNLKPVSKVVRVTKLPKCDFCEEDAHYDGKTTYGPWASMCLTHFDRWGVGLGLGLGQKMVVKGVSEPEHLPPYF